MKMIFHRIRYNFYVSFILSLFLKPIYIFFNFIAKHIEKKVWINGRSVRYDGYQIFFPKNIGVSYSSKIFWKETNGFEADTYYVLKELFIVGDYFFDVGANIGLYSVLAKKNNPYLNVTAFEPIKEIYNQNEIFKLYNSVKYRLHNIALSNKMGYQNIYLPKTNSIDIETTATLRKDSWQKIKNHITYQVETKLLDNIVSEMDIENTAKIIIKIDVEDYETSVLEGMSNTIKKYKPIIICEVLSRNHKNKAFLKQVDKMNYSVFGITTSGCFRMTNMDFCKKRKFRDFILCHKKTFLGENYITSDDLNAIFKI